MSDTDLTAGTAYYNPVSGTTPDGEYEITSVQDTGTGNDLPCRKIAIETIVAPQKPDTVYAICWKDNATRDPSIQCALTRVSFCVESKRHGDSDTGLIDGVVFVVRQNNRIFATATQSVGVNWKRASGTYTQNQFIEIDGSGSPNFTSTGTAIEFGFALRLAVSEDAEPTAVVLFDNLCIGVNGCVCPCGDSPSYALTINSTGCFASGVYVVNRYFFSSGCILVYRWPISTGNQIRVSFGSIFSIQLHCNDQFQIQASYAASQLDACGFSPFIATKVGGVPPFDNGLPSTISVQRLS